MGNLLSNLLAMSIAGSAVVGLMLLLRPVTAKIFPAKLQYGIGKMGIAFFIIPVSLFAEKVFYALPQTTTQNYFSGAPPMAIPGALRFLANVQETDKIIYPPAKHAQMICALYENFGIKPVIGNTSAEAGNKQPTIMEMSVNNKLSLALIRFLQYGEDFEQRIHETLYRVKREGIQVVQVRLNLEDPQTSIVAEQLEKKGFIFTGILPGTTGGDLMSMQYFNGIAVDYDAIHVFSNRGQELLDYIRRHDTMGGIN